MRPWKPKKGKPGEDRAGKKILGQTQKEKRTSLSQAQVLQRQIENQEKKNIAGPAGL
ncbi:MAG: hypothetical protein LRY55_09315 [Leadbetterella sp.]|nr:hypothetical protein [Leadbetterella sp.]